MKCFCAASLTITVIITLTTWTYFCNGLPLVNEMISLGEGDETSPSSTQNDSLKDLYIIKAIVYEIGILTDASEEDNTTSTETQERVDLTFFNAHTNDTHIDLGQIPLPVQTNISGQVLTALAPFDLGAFSDPSELLKALPLTGTIVNISHSDTAFFQLRRTSNLTEQEEPHLLTPDDIALIPDVADVIPEISENIQEIVGKEGSKLIINNGDNKSL